MEFESPFVLAIDAGTSSVRALVFDRNGRRLPDVEGRRAYQMNALPDGGVEADPDVILGLAFEAIDEALAGAQSESVSSEIRCVALCTFWHSLLGVDSHGRAVTPLYNWSDTRSRDDADRLAQDKGVAWFHSRTGAIPHSSYYPAKLRWIARVNPAAWSAAARWISFGEYFHQRLFGRPLCSVSMASGTGLFNPNSCDWDDEVLRATGLTRGQLSPIADDAEANAGLDANFRSRWPGLGGIPWTAAIGDGAASNIGSGCTTMDVAALNLGTSGAMRVCWKADRLTIPSGLWCYRADRRYMLLGGALSNGGDVLIWSRKHLRVDAAELNSEIEKMEPDNHGLTVLPFFSGERSTGWADRARASVTGMTLATTAIDVIRATTEAVAYRFAAIHQKLRTQVPGVDRIIVSGGAFAALPCWAQIIADVTGVAVARSSVTEASSRGAALLSLESQGLIPNLAEAGAPGIERLYQPDAGAHARYREARRRHEQLYELLVRPLAVTS